MNNRPFLNIYCSSECRKESQKLRNKKYLQKSNNRYYKKHKKELSIRRGHDKDLSPNQQGKENLSITEKQKLINNLYSAVPKALSNNKYSNRQGRSVQIQYNKITGKEYKYWNVDKKINGVRFRKGFNSETKAIQYLKYIENTYYTPEQLAIRDKYSE